MEFFNEIHSSDSRSSLPGASSRMSVWAVSLAVPLEAHPVKRKPARRMEQNCFMDLIPFLDFLKKLI
jgi:hypothetical protein